LVLGSKFQKMKNVELQTIQTGALMEAVLRSRIMLMRLWLRAKILMRLRRLRLLPYIASQKFLSYKS
jgi:hypothetical protein